MSDPVCVIELGRYGDIINVLPICRHLHRRGKRVHLIVSEEFAGLLSGVSYVVPDPVELRYDQINRVLPMARSKYPTVYLCQVYGIGYRLPRMTDSFNRESWRLAGFLDHFHDASFALEFDKRDPVREEELRTQVFRTEKPKIVTNLTRAISAPLWSGGRVLELLTDALSDRYEIVETGDLKCDALYDLLGLMDAAELLVSIDTSTLHLAAGCKTPLVAVVNDGWGGSVPRFNCAHRLRYSEVDPKPERVIEAVEQALAKA